MKTTFQNLLLLIGFLVCQESVGQCTVELGMDRYVCVDKFNVVDTTELEVNYTGSSDVNFKWETYYTDGVNKFYASDFLDDTTVLSPRITNGDVDNLVTVNLKLTVYNSSGTLCRDSTNVTFSKFKALLFLPYADLNQGDSVQIYPASAGGVAPLSYRWTPDYKISNNNAERPFVSPARDTTYDCIVRDSVGCVSGYSDEWTINVIPVSVEQHILFKDKVTIYPHPINGNSILKIDHVQPQQLTFRLLNVEGKLIKEEDFFGKQLAIGDLFDPLPKGKYILSLLIKEKTVFVTKLVK